jgi:prepilin-type N-terminal cleavage/methylation domain-containing protein
MRTTRAGFTLIEIMMVVTVAGTAAVMAFPKVAQTVNHSRVNQAATIVAGDLELASSLADRQRKPVRITISNAAKTVTVTDRASGNVLSKKAYGITSEYHLTTVSGSPTTIDLFPNGTVSQSLTLTFTLDGYTRHVTMTRAGQVRVTP